MPKYLNKLNWWQLSLFFSIYICPTSLMAIGVIPFAYRFHLLVVLGSIMCLYAYWRGFSLQTLGIRKDNLFKTLIIYLFACLVVVLVLVLVSSTGIIRALNPPVLSWFYIFYVFISSPIQEYLYRSLVFAELNQFTKYAWLRILLSAINFGWLHVIYLDVIILIATFIAGIIWGIFYECYPNWFSISVSHAIIGIISILLGII